MNGSVVRQVADIQKLGLGQIRDSWRELFGKDPPGCGRAFLVKRLAHRIQELEFGGLSGESRDSMRAVLDESGDGTDAAARRKAGGGAPVPGTLLVREWNGKRCEVLAVEGGYELEGRRYRSLSAVAKAITGSHWNGPLFFGLRKNGGAR